MQGKSVGKRALVLDFEAVFDVWSLCFCICRKNVANYFTANKTLSEDESDKKEITGVMTNDDYSLIVNQSIQQAIKNVTEKFGLEIKDKAALDQIKADSIREFSDSILSVKPWIPYIQLIKQVSPQPIYFRSHIEPEYK